MIPSCRENRKGRTRKDAAFFIQTPIRTASEALRIMNGSGRSLPLRSCL